MKETFSKVESALAFILVVFIGAMASMETFEVVRALLITPSGGTIPYNSIDGAYLGLLLDLGVPMKLLIASGITVVISALAVINHFTNMGAKIKAYIDCRNNKGAFEEYKHAQGSIQMSFETFDTLFSANPEMYKIGHLNHICIPRILYNNQWKVPVEGNYVSVVDYEVFWDDILPRECTQIRLSYRDQCKLLKKLSGSRYDDRIIEKEKEEQRLLTRGARESLVAIEMCRSLDRVASNQNNENVEKAKKSLEVLQGTR